ncbi:sterol desaturase family protein [Kushneria konosiri]|uniref:Beta-carotene hydroxylase n=1 Tax=Kushneria konosiri TaxID=698828 RepID=A0A2Z2H728_9GAMM|nr:sterol desaturase family protein [Kushneria konosiri]ARS53104.1 beta-carotene hydroxylase [Kushneria konosiri]
MGDVLIWVMLFLLAFAGMEFVAWFTHRYIMHGFLWCWHRSHHNERHGLFELNDLFAVIFALPSVVLIYNGLNGHAFQLALGLGIAAYGLVYFMFHDGLVHRRFPVPFNRQQRFWKRRIQAHRMHHAVETREGAVSFGFLVVRPINRLKRELAERRRF